MIPQRPKVPAHLRAGNGQAPQEGMLLAVPGAFTRTSLVLEPGIPYEGWERIGDTLRRIGGGVLWWIGDWLNYGERAYGEKYAQAVDEKQAAIWMQYAYVAGRFEVSRRLEIVSWSTHQALAAVDDEKERYSLLQRASEERWTVKQAREMVRDYKQVPGAHGNESGSSLVPPVEMGEYLVALLRDVGQVVVQRRDRSRGLTIECRDLTGPVWDLLTEAHELGVKVVR